MKNSNPFEGSEITSILVVKDINRSREFYTQVLGAEILREYEGTTIVLKFLEHWMLLVTKGEPGPDKPEVHFSEIQDKNQVHHSFTIRVKDCQKSYDILKSRGAEFITPPYDWGYEIRAFFHDPDGHLFEISEIPNNG